MKKGLVIGAFLVFVLNVTCKKNNDPQNSFQSYLRFKIDNLKVECNANIKATYIPATIGPDDIITISGNWPEGAIELDLQQAGQALTPGTYTFTEPLRSGEIWIYPDGAYYAAGWCIVCGGPSSSGQITITEISPEFVKGTFNFVTWTEPIRQDSKNRD